MRKLFVILAALAAIGLTLPAYAGQSPEQSAQSSPQISRETVERAVAAVAAEKKLVELDERIAKARRGISSGKKKLLFGGAIFATGVAIAYTGNGPDACWENPGLSLKGCTTRQKVGLFTAVGGGLVAIGGAVEWPLSAARLRRAEAERRQLTSIAVSPTAVAANYRFSW